MISQEAIRSAFAKPIAPVREPVHYRLAVAGVALAMVLLPLIYVGLVALAAWSWLFYVTGVLPELGRFNALTLSPVFAGPILILFLLKPLLARPEKSGDPMTLRREQAPLLFELVDRLCDNVGAPRPTRIDADVQVNASASLRRGLLSLFSRDLVLTIGLPLVHGLTLREFTAVLAHEFGHFRQGAGMGLNYIIRTISFWFARVVFVRDAWDARLVRWSGLDWRISIVVYIARFFIWVSRKILHGLMLVGNALAGFLSRQMEFDADQVAVRVTGHEAFAATMRRLPVLDLASSWAHSDLAQSWNKGRLGDDFPALVAANLMQLPDDKVKEVVDSAMAGAASMYASHPPTQQRIGRAEATPSDGVFREDGPATDLFTDFAATCREASLHSYRLWIGDQVTPDKLVDSAHVAAEGAAAQRQRLIREQVFQGWYDGAVWFHMPQDEPAEAGGDRPAEAGLARDAADKAFGRLTLLAQLAAFADAGLHFKASEFDLNSPARADIEHAARVTERELAAAASTLRSATPGLIRRAWQARDRAAGAVRELATLERVEPQVNALLTEMRTGQALLEQIEANSGHEQLHNVVLAQGPAIYRAIEALESALGAEGAAMFGWQPVVRDPEDHPVKALNAAVPYLNRMTSGYYRALGELAEAIATS